jgi:hypothetical protein
MCGCAGKGSEEGRTVYGGDSRELGSPVGSEIGADGAHNDDEEGGLNIPCRRIVHD